MDEAKRILAETSSDAVRLVAYRAWVRSLGLEGRFDTMLDTAFFVL
ncbi:MAG: hypothetical protein FJY97_07675 [candidate division Zixibacteria bacterium]|nr:hypothetical protein [candidate division Zixibacteria bacterium]